MALSDDDKRYIEGLVSKSEKKTESRMKIDAIKQQEKEKHDKLEYIEILKQRQDAGNATLAQKVELLKAQVSNSISDDIKSAGRYTGGAISSGAGQVGQGLSTINRKIMNSNPLTAALYQQRDLFGAIGNVAIGTGKMVGGAAVGLGKALAGGVNALINRKKKDKEEKESKQIKGNDGKLLPALAVGTLAVKELLNEKNKDTEIKKITAFEQKESPIMKIIKKGFDGLQKTLTETQKTVKSINGKSKKILLGILMGATAIFALKKWFESGGFKTLLTNAINGIKNFVTNLPSNLINGTDNALNTMNGMSEEEKNKAIQKFQQTYGKNATMTGMSNDQFKSTVNKLNLEGKIGGITSANYITNSSGGITGVKYETTEMAPVLAPWLGWVLHFQLEQMNGDYTYCIAILRLSDRQIIDWAAKICVALFGKKLGEVTGGAIGNVAGTAVGGAVGGVPGAIVGKVVGGAVGKSVGGAVGAVSQFLMAGTIAAKLVSGKMTPEQISKKLGSHVMYFHGVIQPQVHQFQVVHKDDFIGFASKGFYITSGDQGDLKDMRENYAQHVQGEKYQNFKHSFNQLKHRNAGYNLASLSAAAINQGKMEKEGGDLNKFSNAISSATGYLDASKNMYETGSTDELRKELTGVEYGSSPSLESSLKPKTVTYMTNLGTYTVPQYQIDAEEQSKKLNAALQKEKQAKKARAKAEKEAQKSSSRNSSTSKGSNRSPQPATNVSTQQLKKASNTGNKSVEAIQ